jgi:DNA-binding Lrp family transcriptional regulator
MKTKQGEYKEPKKKQKEPGEVMECRLIYLEPALWDLMARLATKENKTRSTFIRCAIKDSFYYLSGIKNINWNESNK